MKREMKRIVKQCLSVGKDSVRFVLFFMEMLLRSGLHDPFKRKYQGKVAVLANGPSLKGVLPKLQSEEFAGTDFIVMNYFGKEEVFTRIKPKHYCLADPMFFYSGHREKEARSLFSLLNEAVDWDMNLYIPKGSVKYFKSFSALSNPYIHLVPLNIINYKGFECFRNFFYKHGLSMPLVNSVAIMAIFVGINSGYKQIDLYGVDHNFFESIYVNENNQLCNRETHFYDKDEVTLKPILRYENSQVLKVGDYIIGIGGIFIGHDLLAAYAHYRNVRIVNCTECSMIDSYERNKYL